MEERDTFTFFTHSCSYFPFTADGATDTIPRACQLNSDVSQFTQVLNMNKLRSTEQKHGGHLLTAPELGML